jgi:hypothetical protein
MGLPPHNTIPFQGVTPFVPYNQLPQMGLPPYNVPQMNMLPIEYFGQLQRGVPQFGYPKPFGNIF